MPAAQMRYSTAMNLVLKSERLLLRPLAEEDLDLCIQILTDPEVMKYVTKTQTRDQVVAELPLSMRRCAGGAVGIWCVIEHGTREKLGTAVLLPLPIEEEDTNWDLILGDDVADCEIEISYLLKPSAWGRGYATEACTRLLRFAFAEARLDEVVAVTDPLNQASQNVLRKSGLIDEGMRRAYAGQAPGFRLTRRQWLEKFQQDS